MTGHILNSMGRPAKNREYIVQAGMKLLMERGYHAMSVKDLADEAGIPKGSVYNYFDNKDDLAIQVLHEYADRVCSNLEAMLLGTSGTAKARLRKHFDKVTSTQCTSGGCLAGNLAQELAFVDKRYGKELEEVFSRFEKVFAIFFERAKVDGEISGDESAKELAEFVVTGIQGALLRSKTTGTSRPVKLFVKRLMDELFE